MKKRKRFARVNDLGDAKLEAGGIKKVNCVSNVPYFSKLMRLL